MATREYVDDATSVFTDPCVQEVERGEGDRYTFGME